MKLKFIDLLTGEEPKDLSSEDWVKDGLCWTDIEGFALTEDLEIVLLDECGNYIWPPADRFAFVFE